MSATSLACLILTASQLVAGAAVARTHRPDEVLTRREMFVEPHRLTSTAMRSGCDGQPSSSRLMVTATPGRKEPSVG